MTLLYITNGITGSGGLERVLSIKASMLAEDFGYDVHLLSLNEIDQESFFSFSDRVQIHSIAVIGNPLSYFLHYKNGIQKLINQVRPDIISVCDDGLKGFFLPRIISTKAKWIYERHVSKLIEENGNQNIISATTINFKWKLMEYLGKYYTKFILLTEGNRCEWLSLKNVKIIGNPLPFQNDQIASLDEKTVICVGKISYQKGQDLLLQIWGKVAKRHPNWKLHLYGKENKDFVNTDHLKDNIFHFPPVKNLEKAYCNSSIYVMPSRFEGFGMVLIEAMNFGIPCISFNCNYGPSDIISNNEDGYLVDNEDLDLFSIQIIKLIENVPLRKEMGKKARQNVQRFSAKSVVQQWDTLFKEILN